MAILRKPRKVSATFTDRFKLLARRGKIVHVIRHGEAEHNVRKSCLKRRDTHLTLKGIRQATGLNRILPRIRPELVVSSGVLRALQTTKCMGFEGKTVVMPDAREVASWPANQPIALRRVLSGDLRQQFGQYDWSYAIQDWKKAGGEHKYQEKMKKFDRRPSNLRRRVKKLTQMLEACDESNIAVVSHGEFLERLTGDEYMDNCEVRSYLLSQGKWLPLMRHKQLNKDML